MLTLNNKLIDLVKENELSDEVFKGNFGLERENVRVTKSGDLSLTPHPDVFGDKSSNPYITTDFSESQLEIVTPVKSAIEDAYNTLDTLNNIVVNSLEDEYLWPQSAPPILPDESLIPIAKFSDDQSKDESYAYRKELANKYGKKKQIISGIHYNFSFQDTFIKSLYDLLGEGENLEHFKDNMYLKMMRNITKNSWLLIYLLGSSPAIHESYATYCEQCDNSTSFRNGSCGYHNFVDYYLPMASTAQYATALKKLVHTGELIDEREYYGVIRPKQKNGKVISEKSNRIEYLELRLLDINPLFKNGISLEDAKLIHLFLMHSLLSEDKGLTLERFTEAMVNNKAISDMGRHSEVLLKQDAQENHVSVLAMALLEDFGRVAFLNKEDSYSQLLASFKKMVENPSLLYANRVYEEVSEHGFIDYHLNKAKQFKEESRGKEFNISGGEDLELSTQILMLDAMKRGVTVDILDRKENFIRLERDGQVELVKQATKTSKDNYSAVLAMENKIVTKEILKKASINVPFGENYIVSEEAKNDYSFYAGKEIVIKPNTTNFGLGITIFKEPFTEEDFIKAIDHAFAYDETILIEAFVEGKEYRIFVIGDEVVGVLHRVPANVIGDGKRSIRELVEEKNMSPLRGTGYRKPLQKIQLGQDELTFLEQSGNDFDTIVADNQTVYLRENSNISTGGDSIDMTDVISEELKAVAVKAAKAMDAEITGVDLMTTDLRGTGQGDYTIIEVNFNPAIHIHCFPFKGQNRKLGDKVLNLLGY